MATVTDDFDSINLAPPELDDLAGFLAGCEGEERDGEPDPFALLRLDVDGLPPDWPHQRERAPRPFPLISAAEWLDSVAGYHRSLDTDLGDLVAGRIEMLADYAREIGPGATARQITDRIAWEEAEWLQSVEAQGYNRGVAATERHYSEWPPLW